MSIGSIFVVPILFQDVCVGGQLDKHGGKMKSRRDIKMKTKRYRYHPKITHPLAFLKPTFKDKPPHSTGSSGHVSRKSSLKLQPKKN